jgi:methylisocitrate lyase
MSKDIVNTHAYPFQFIDPLPKANAGTKSGVGRDFVLNLPNVRGRIPSIQASRLRTMMLEAHNDPNKIMAHACSMDGMTSRLVEEAGFPMVFLAGYPCASSYG